MKRTTMIFLGLILIYPAIYQARPIWAADESDNPLGPADRPPVFSVPDTSPERQDSGPRSEDINEDLEHPLGHGTPGIALLGGAAIYSFPDSSFIAPTAAVRYYFKRRDADTEGPAALSHWSAEFGGIITKHANSNGSYDSGNPLGSEIRMTGSSFYGLEVTSVSELHLAGQYQWLIRKPVRMVPQISLGVSVTKVKNEINWSNGQQGGFDSVNVTSVSPLVRLGLPVLANDWFALRMDMGYAHFANKFSFQGQEFDKTLSGVGFYPSVQVSIGYLTPGIEAGSYLRADQLPLWALAAVQTEKKSPIIAAPEAVLNPRQTSAMLGNVLFQYKDRWASRVELVGDFNHWIPEPMCMDKSHTWITIKDLPRGTYHYTILINGHREIRDPWNANFDPSQRLHGCSTFAIRAEYNRN